MVRGVEFNRLGELLAVAFVSFCRQTFQLVHLHCAVEVLGCEELVPFGFECVCHLLVLECSLVLIQFLQFGLMKQKLR